mgnify:CR=1 FL=1
MKRTNDIEAFAVQIPDSLENMQLPSPELLTMYKNYEERVLWLDCEISYSSLEAERMILQWNREDKGLPVEKRKPIKLLIFSLGGDLSVYDSIADVISLSKTKVIGINMGIAASAACCIFLSCHERLTLPNSRFLLHRGSVDGLSGTYAEIVSAIDDYQEQIERLCDAIINKTKIKREDIDEKMQSDWYLSAEEAVKYGLCSKIVDDIDDIL